LTLRHAREHGIEKPDAPRLRYLSSGGAPLDRDWKRRVEAFFGVTLHNGYGLTEVAPGVAATRVGMERSDTACGPPLPGVEVKLVPPPGQSEMQGGVGEILVRGPNVMKGYYKNPEATREVLQPDGWLYTGDLGKFTADGALMVVGRSKELIIRSGFNVYPPEVEAVLTEHPAVVLAAVVGRSEPGGNEEVIAFVQTPKPAAASEAELKAFCAERLATYKRPARIIVTDRLPTGSTGKILKAHLLRDFAAELEAAPAK
jgi:acyl-CoA synthetase (AMP-forming)/AMP-acid ligase II